MFVLSVSSRMVRVNKSIHMENGRKFSGSRMSVNGNITPGLGCDIREAIEVRSRES